MSDTALTAAIIQIAEAVGADVNTAEIAMAAHGAGDEEWVAFVAGAGVGGIIGMANASINMKHDEERSTQERTHDVVRTSS